ncbi:hypothetical protein [Reinekea sp. G2M2-21]|uniref:hypothetical protein n=1 Tax=Reinekea sp. G2M2-21 TaxID=2788942 RepID=UPI0018AB6D60|nr:hypothetical protein [Reinekea sp. G2M2-21]
MRIRQFNHWQPVRRFAWLTTGLAGAGLLVCYLFLFGDVPPPAWLWPLIGLEDASLTEMSNPHFGMRRLWMPVVDWLHFGFVGSGAFAIGMDRWTHPRHRAFKINKPKKKDQF